MCDCVAGKCMCTGRKDMQRGVQRYVGRGGYAKICRTELAEICWGKYAEICTGVGDCSDFYGEYGETYEGEYVDL